MATQLLATKLYIPPPRSKIVLRPRLLGRLNDALNRKLTLISAPAGFGKSTLVSEWVAGGERPVAWLSLDEGDNDPTRFLMYLITALQTLDVSHVEGTATRIGAGTLGLLQAPQPPPVESILTTLLNEIAVVPEDFVLVLDDYHVLDAKVVDNALAFLLEHLPSQMHLVIATREDPHLPLARLRARDQLTELRAADLRFTPAEAADFLNQVMGLNLSPEDIVALETRTEGWIAGLQLAALSMQGHEDVTSFIKSFTGSHHFVMDYLVEEVLGQQPESVQSFLLCMSILGRMCGPLCDAVLRSPSASGQETLEYLERANLFIVPLDNERYWFRYHHLFADLLRQRLRQCLSPGEITELHIHASEWYEQNDLVLEAFRHAVAANDVERAVRLVEGKEMPLHIPGTATAILNWLESLPTTILNSQPALWCKQAELMVLVGQTTRVEEKLKATETALVSATLPDTELDDQTKDLIGKIAAIRSNLALTQQQAETMLVQARRALEYLHPNNLAYRSSAIRDMGFAYYLQGNRIAAGQTFAESLSIAQASGDVIEPLLATIGLAEIQVLENQLSLAAETYQSILQQVENYSPLNAGVVHLGLAWICYEWNDLDAAERYGERSLQLARQYNQIIKRFITSGVFLSRLKLVRGDVGGAATLLAQAEQSARQHNFMHQMPEIAAVQVLMLLCRGDLATAAELAQRYELPMSQARVLLAQGKPSAALAVLGLYRQQMEVKNWQDERLKVIVLQAVAFYANHETDKARQVLGDALTLAEPGGFIRLFVDEGERMRLMICDFRVSILRTAPHLSAYLEKLLAAFPTTPAKDGNSKSEMVEPLSQRELDVLRLIAQGLSNDAISKRLFLALSTVKGHNRIIFDKLHVQSRTEAVARARELGLL